MCSEIAFSSETQRVLLPCWKIGAYIFVWLKLSWHIIWLLFCPEMLRFCQKCPWFCQKLSWFCPYFINFSAAPISIWPHQCWHTGPYFRHKSLWGPKWKKWSLFGPNYGILVLIFKKLSHERQILLNHPYILTSAWVWQSACYIYQFCNCVNPMTGLISLCKPNKISLLAGMGVVLIFKNWVTNGLWSLKVGPWSLFVVLIRSFLCENLVLILVLIGPKTYKDLKCQHCLTKGPGPTQPVRNFQTTYEDDCFSATLLWSN
jgi:hypothetical protein